MTEGARSAGDHTREGVEHLRGAAKEMISAARAFLDAAEDLVDDPDAAAEILDLVSGLAGRAAARVRPEDPAPGTRSGGDADGGGGRVQRIRVV